MPNTDPNLSSASYVYPIRSLLSGTIQRARNDNAGGVTVDLSRRDSTATTFPTGNASTSKSQSKSGPSRPRRRTVSESSAPSSKVDSTPTKKSKKRRPRSSNVPPNFRHFPGEDAPPNLRRTFTATSISSLTQGDLPPDTLAVFSQSASVTDVASPSPTVALKPLQRPRSELRARPKQVPVSDDPLPPEEVPDAETQDPPLPWSESQLDLVRLPPLPSDSTTSSLRGSSHHSASNRGTSSRSANNSPGPHDQSKFSSPPPAEDTRRSDSSRSSAPGPSAVSSGSQSGSRSGSHSGSESQSASGSDASDASQFLTVRFQHLTDENGHHLILGREGKLSRCEDEPIRTPGAVQGFGVLIAVDELEDALVVRQVSENAEELLGLPPRYLFSLECFTDTLPDSQAGALWDNIQFLSESGMNTQEEEASPHVFLITGWGAPGSAAPGDQEASNGRRSWTCWCAVHRPSDPTGNGNSGLVIMEFELERDSLNPLYPPSDYSQDVGTPGSVGSSGSGNFSTPSTENGGGGSSTDGSEQTLMGAEAQTTPTPTTDAPTEEKSDPVLELEVANAKANMEAANTSAAGPSTEEILESTTSRARPLLALERLRRMARGELAGAETPGSPGEPRSRRARRSTTSGASGGVGMMDVFAVMAQINEQLGDAPDLTAFLQVVVGVIKDLSQFHRVLVYQFDEAWNGQVVAELLDWSKTHDLYRGLHFPAADIPAQARQLYAINKVRLLYDRSQSTARIVVRSQEDLKHPLNMTHCYLRAMSPIHIKYLENMGVRASMSVSIMAFGALWGLVTCHAYGSHGMRVSFPVRQMLRLLSQSISRNIERLSYAQRLTTRKLINTMASPDHPTGYIVSNADDLLGLFDADFGVLVIGEAAKMLGPNEHGQEILIVAEYLRLKQFLTMQVSQAVTTDFKDLAESAGLDVIAGMLYVPLSSEGKDFICFLRKGQPRHVQWAGNPHTKTQTETLLEPRKSFATWSETVVGRCRGWTDEQLETAGVLALVYGKFIEVWRQKENALQTTRLTNLLLSNASHEVRTPLNHIINYLEMALNGPLDDETRDNLSRSHAASKSLLFTINDLLDLTRLESGNETTFNEPFDLQYAIEDATHLYRKEAQRRNIEFHMELEQSPKVVIGDSKKIRTVVQNLTANSLKYTSEGTITVACATYDEPAGLRGPKQTAVEIVVEDTGCGIAPDRLASIFREFEQVEPLEPRPGSAGSLGSGGGVGLGLAVVARIVEQLGGQLRVESKVDEGSRFSFLIPLSLSEDGEEMALSPSSSKDSSFKSLQVRSRRESLTSSGAGDIDSLVEAIASNHMAGPSPQESLHRRESSSDLLQITQSTMPGVFGISDSSTPIRPVKVDDFGLDTPAISPGREELKDFPGMSLESSGELPPQTPAPEYPLRQRSEDSSKLRVLIVEDNDINRTVLAKRLRLDGHNVVTTTNGQEGLDKVISDRGYDAILMDIQMPILNGYEATERIRDLEKATPSAESPRRSHRHNGGHIPIFAVSASLQEERREEMINRGIDGWILKPIDFKRLKIILSGVTNRGQRETDIYQSGCSWEAGGWLVIPPSPPPSPPELPAPEA
ncbi:ATP-binding cassette transporter [Favolaschia claudopus]|uniref:ATP-binding cassette transporter n=1 Tax=Favolaschia claudopus TaxID=2862362 RepID=A0AAW0D5T0_9AGAR